MAHHLAQSGSIHCLATDSHNPQDRHAAHVKLAAAKIQNLIGRDNLLRIAGENPRRVLRGVPLLPMIKPEPKATVRKERRWLFWQNPN